MAFPWEGEDSPCASIFRQGRMPLAGKYAATPSSNHKEAGPKEPARLPKKQPEAKCQELQPCAKAYPIGTPMLLESPGLYGFSLVPSSALIELCSTKTSAPSLTAGEAGRAAEMPFLALMSGS